MINTRIGNVDSWTPIIGKARTGMWEFDLSGNRERFQNEEMTEILFVVTYSGHTPAWPA